MELPFVVEPWHWLILGFVFLICEMLGAGGFLLGGAISGVLMAVIVWGIPGLTWPWQLCFFAILSVIATWTYYKCFFKTNNKTIRKNLNNRAAQLIGRVVVVEERITCGQGRIKIGDTLWKVRSDVDIDVGANVQVLDAEGMVLIVRPYADNL